MATAPLYNQAGKKVGDVDLDKKIFDVDVRPELVQQAVRTLQANRRQPIAHAKGRSEVQGGGRKPWRQKGTGRARHGSIRSPLWVGGGVTFGPTKERNYSLKMNRKAKRKALLMTLSDKAAEKKIYILEELSADTFKTKKVAEMLKNLKITGSVLLALPTADKKVIISSRNIPSVTTIQAHSLNPEAVLAHEYLIVPKAALDTLSKTFA